MNPERPPARRSLAYHAIPAAYLLLAVVAWPDPPVCNFGDVDIEIYGVIARMWSRGFLPYAAFFDFKPPLTFLLLRVGFTLWGPNAAVVWKLQVVLVTSTAIAVFYILLRRDRPASAVMASAALLTLGVFDAAGLGQFLRNTELWAALPLIVSLALLWHPRRAGFRASAFLSGLGFGLALSAKQQAGPFLVPLLWLVCREGWALGPPRRLSGIVRALALFGLGTALPLALFALYFAWYGALAAAVDAVVVDGLRYAALPDLRALPSARDRLRALSAAQAFLTRPSLVPYTGCALAALALARRKSRDRGSLLLVCLAPALAVMLAPAFYPHYLVLFLPALVFAVMQAGEILLGSAASVGSRRPAAVLLFTAVLVFGPAVLVFAQRPPPHPPCPGTRDALLTQLGAAIAARAEADDRLLVWDLPPCLYVYADIPPATRFFYDVPYSFGYKALHDDLKRALEQLPAFIAVSSPNTPLGRLDTSADALRGLLREHYDLLTQNAGGMVFVRRPAATGGPSASGGGIRGRASAGRLRRVRSGFDRSVLSAVEGLSMSGKSLF